MNACYQGIKKDQRREKLGGGDAVARVGESKGEEKKGESSWMVTSIEVIELRVSGKYTW